MNMRQRLLASAAIMLIATSSALAGGGNNNDQGENNNDQGNYKAPEIDAVAGTSAIALLTGVVLLMKERSRSKRSSESDE